MVDGFVWFSGRLTRFWVPTPRGPLWAPACLAFDHGPVSLSRQLMFGRGGGRVVHPPEPERTRVRCVDSTPPPNAGICL